MKCIYDGREFEIPAVDVYSRNYFPQALVTNLLVEAKHRLTPPNGFEYEIYPGEQSRFICCCLEIEANHDDKYQGVNWWLVEKINSLCRQSVESYLNDKYDVPRHDHHLIQTIRHAWLDEMIANSKAFEALEKEF